MSMIEINQQNKRVAGVVAILIVAAYAIQPIRDIISPIADFKILEGMPWLTPITIIAIGAVIAAFLAKDRNL